MNVTRNGKIARLPQAVRDELNQRIGNGQKGVPLLKWLNSLSETLALVAADFGGGPVCKQNLSAWRRGGYADWLRTQEALVQARQMAAAEGEFRPAGTPPLTDQMALWVTVHYLLTVRKLAEAGGPGEMDLNVLRKFCHDVVALRRGDHSAARLKMVQERLEANRTKRGRQ